MFNHKVDAISKNKNIYLPGIVEVCFGYPYQTTE